MAWLHACTRLSKYHLPPTPLVRVKLHEVRDPSFVASLAETGCELALLAGAASAPDEGLAVLKEGYGHDGEVAELVDRLRRAGILSCGVLPLGTDRDTEAFYRSIGARLAAFGPDLPLPVLIIPEHGAQAPLHVTAASASSMAAKLHAALFSWRAIAARGMRWLRGQRWMGLRRPVVTARRLWTYTRWSWRIRRLAPVELAS